MSKPKEQIREERAKNRTPLECLEYLVPRGWMELPEYDIVRALIIAVGEWKEDSRKALATIYHFDQERSLKLLAEDIRDFGKEAADDE